jgi:hypothetical protein
LAGVGCFSGGKAASTAFGMLATSLLGIAGGSDVDGVLLLLEFTVLVVLSLMAVVDSTLASFSSTLTTSAAFT